MNSLLVTIFFFFYTLAKTHLFVQLNGFKDRKLLNISIWPKDGALTSITIPGQREPGSKGNEGVFHILQRSRIGA